MDYGVETIKRQTRLRMAGWSQFSLWAQAYPTAYRPYASLVCDMNSASAATVCGLGRYTSIIMSMPLPLQNSKNEIQSANLCYYQIVLLISVCNVCCIPVCIKQCNFGYRSYSYSFTYSRRQSVIFQFQKSIQFQLPFYV